MSVISLLIVSRLTFLDAVYFTFYLSLSTEMHYSYSLKDHFSSGKCSIIASYSSLLILFKIPHLEQSHIRSYISVDEISVDGILGHCMK